MAWANVAKSLNCIIAMSDRLLGREDRPQDLTPSEQQEAAAGDTNSQNTGVTLFYALLVFQQLVKLNSERVCVCLVQVRPPPPLLPPGRSSCSPWWSPSGTA